MLFTLQRYEFFSKSQHPAILTGQNSGCCLPYKGTNFSANHNKDGSTNVDLGDVVYPTKVRIFQQITTPMKVHLLPWEMLFTLQRYEFFSKSQPCKVISLVKRRCCLPYKGTNFSANHNIPDAILSEFGMLFTLQRYEFFSKSQHTIKRSYKRNRCCLPYKGTNFSANHNYLA